MKTPSLVTSSRTPRLRFWARQCSTKSPHRLFLGGALGQCQGQGVLRGQAHEGGAEQGVGPGGEDRQGLAPAFGQGKIDLRARGFADPVALHGEDPLRPAGQLVQVASSSSA